MRCNDLILKFSWCLESVLLDAWLIFIAVIWAVFQNFRERLNMRVCSDQSYSQAMSLTSSESDRDGLPQSSLIWCVSSKKAQVKREYKRFHCERDPFSTGVNTIHRSWIKLLFTRNLLRTPTLIWRWIC